MKLANKTIIITGGSRGIGFGTAKFFLDEGANVAITSKTDETLQIATKKLNGVLGLKVDIRNQDQIDKAVKEIISHFGKIDVLINNTGIFPEFKIMDKITEDEWNEIIDVNLSGTFRFTKAVVPYMKKTGGSIINMGSVAGLKGFENFPADAYSASKAAIILLTKAWAIEYAEYNIRFNCICPAVIDTDMTKKSWLSSKENLQNTIEQHPLKRIGTVGDVAKAILYFASDDSSWTTGTILSVDGGISAK